MGVSRQALMPTYSYRVIDRSGRATKGELFAPSAVALERSLGEQGLLVVDMAEQSAERDRRGIQLGRRREILEATRALAALLPIGMPLMQALGAAANVATGETRTALLTVRERVGRGEMLADALTSHPHIFSPLYAGLVRAGERSGDLETTFARLAEQLEKEEKLRGRLVSASIYPILLGVAGTIAVTVLLVFVLPRFADLLQGSGASLPRATAFMLGVSTWLRRFWPVVILAPLGMVMLTVWMRTTSEGRRVGSRLLMSLPLVRTVRRNIHAARFARLTAVLLGGGAPLLQALDDVHDSLADPMAADDTRRIRTAVREGRSLRESVEGSPIYPALLAQLIGVGEEAGQLRVFLLKAADIFEEKAERAMQRLTTALEPAMIMTFGAIVAFVALSLLQAIYGINEGSFR